jgi:hypothetical protein
MVSVTLKDVAIVSLCIKIYGDIDEVKRSLLINTRTNEVETRMYFFPNLKHRLVIDHTLGPDIGNIFKLGQFSGSDGGEREDDCRLGSCAV